MTYEERGSIHATGKPLGAFLFLFYQRGRVLSIIPCKNGKSLREVSRFCVSE